MSSRTWLAFLALGVIWGVPYFFIKLALQELSPSLIVCGRLVLATVILLPIAWRRGALRPVLAHKRAVLAFALLEFVVPFTAIALAERWISSSVAGILIATIPLIIALISRFFGVHERFGPARVFGLLLGLIGVITLLGLGTISGPLGWAGVGLMVLAILGYAIGPLIVQRHLNHIDPFGPIAASLLIASILLLGPALFALPTQMPSALAISSIAVLGIACTAVAMLLMFYLISHAGAARTAVITYINPAIASLLGVVVLHEHLGFGGLVGLVLILFGSLLGTRGAAVRPVPAAEKPTIASAN
jgi:drug/metabolite transporter (DMT)-like permease